MHCKFAANQSFSLENYKNHKGFCKFYQSYQNKWFFQSFQSKLILCAPFMLNWELRKISWQFGPDAIIFPHHHSSSFWCHMSIFLHKEFLFSSASQWWAVLHMESNWKIQAFQALNFSNWNINRDSKLQQSEGCYLKIGPLIN